MLRPAVQSRLLRGENFVYAWGMASNRMTQAIGALERAVSRLEQDFDNMAAMASAPSSTASPGGVDAAAARAALRSLDELIADMKGEDRG
jgi:hypothetical protein